MTNHNFKNVSTKVSEEMLSRVKAIAKKNNLTVYELIQATLFLILRMEDTPNGLNETEETAINEFKESLSLNFPLANLNLKTSVTECLCFLETRKGTCGAYIKKPLEKDAEICYNSKFIFDRMMCLLFPNQYKKMRMIGADLSSNSLLETISKLIIFYEDNIIDNEIKDLFSDNDRHEWGKSQSDIRKYIGKYNKNIESL